MLKYKKGLINTWDISDGAITTSKIADRAVTDAKISGRLSLSKLPTSSTANRVLTVRTANADPVYDQIYTNDIVFRTNTPHFINTRSFLKTNPLFLPLGLLYDVIRFLDPIVEKWNGSQWVQDTSGSANVLFRGLYANYTIPNGSNEFIRFTFDIGVTHANPCILVIRSRQGPNDLYVTFEQSSDGSNWTPVINNLFLPQEGYGGACNVIPLSSINDYSRYFRITFTWEWKSTEVIILNYIMLYSVGTSQTFDNRRFPFSWNYNGSLTQRVNQSDIKFATHLRPEIDNTYDIGSDTLRWRRVRAVTVSTGDIELANDWKITELEDGVVIKNKDGEEVFRITNYGLWFKGNKIA